MRCLFILDAPLRQSGGGQVNQRNLENLNKKYSVTILPVSQGGGITSLFSYIFFHRLKDFLKIVKLANSESWDLIWFSRSTIAIPSIFLIKRRFRRKIKIFFHNDEAKYFSSLHSNRIAGKFRSAFVKFSQVYLLRSRICKEVLSYAECMVWNEYPNVNFCPYVPKFGRVAKGGVIIKTDVLFVGSKFPPNVEGLNWFIDNCASSISKPVVVIGRDLEKSCRQHADVEYKGYIEDLDPYYKKAAFVICPIFRGAGTKIKIIDAVYNGCTVLIPEYMRKDLEYLDYSGMIFFESAKDLINIINSSVGSTTHRAPKIRNVNLH